MYDKDNPLFHNPLPLQEASVDYICENLDKVCTSVITEPGGDPKLKFIDENKFFHTELSEQLIIKLCEKNKMDDLVLSLFSSECTRLKHVKLKNASSLSIRGLKTLKGHKILDLEVIGLTRATVTDLISCLGEWSLQNLRLLNVANSTFMDNKKFCVVVALSKLQNLQVLNVARTEFSNSSLELVVEDLPRLESLNMSCTNVNDISALRKIKNRLKYLAMAGLKFPLASSDKVVDVVTSLRELVYLDVSEDSDDRAPGDLVVAGDRFRVKILLLKHKNWPNLRYFDISGKEEIEVEVMTSFLSSHQLNFLGVFLNDICRDRIFTDPTHPAYFGDKVVSGYGNERQILDALRRYIDRPLYITKALYFLFKMTTGNFEARIENSSPRIDIITLVLSCAREYPSVFQIQMAATACLFNLSKADLSNKIHPRILRDIVKTDLDAMETFPQHQQLQKNVLLTISSLRILQEVEFDKYRCARLVLDCLCSWQDHHMNKMSVAICSILAAKISTEETSELGSQPNYMKKLLSIVRGRTQDAVVDITMKFTLSALWNLTDDSPRTCQVFLDENGMELYIKVLKSFPGTLAIETKVLGLFNNIAEVPDLRDNLMLDTFVEILRNLLHSSNIEVSYFAAGIVAHLTSNAVHRWDWGLSAKTITKKSLAHELWTVVNGWMEPEDDLFAYRSFKPFFSLLDEAQEEGVQLWAVWAIHHVCSKNSERYCSMLLGEGGHKVLLDLVRTPTTHHVVANIAEQVLQTMVQKGLLSQQETIGQREVFVSF